MDFFNDLLTSYALLKKRKLSIVLDEGVSIDTQGQGEAPSYAAILSRGGKNGNAHADEVIKRTDAHMAKVFPGVDVAAMPKPKGEVNDGGSASLQPAMALEPDMKLIAYGAQDQGDTGTESTTNGDGDKKPAKPKAPCGKGIVWQTKPNEMVIYRTCKVGGQATSTYRTMVARHFWRGGTNAEDYAENIDPWVMYMQNSREGSHLLPLFKDNPEVISQLTALMRKGWGDGKPKDSFYDPEKASSIFGVLAKTMRTQGQRHINLGTIEDPVIVEAQADELHTLGALQTMVKALDIVIRKPISGDDAEWMRKNLFFVTDRYGNKQLYFESGDGTGVNYTAAPGEYDNFLKQFEDYNKLVGDTFPDNPESFQIKEVDRKVIYDHSDAGVKSQKVITEVSEEISAVIQILKSPNSKFTKEERAQKASQLYHALQDTYGDNINKVIRAITNLTGEGVALTQDYESLIEAFHTWKNSYHSGETQASVDIDTRKFFAQIERLVTKKVLEADADFVVRVGTGGGSYGFKSDQLYLYRADDKTGLDRASKFMGGAAGGFDATPRRFQDIVRNGVPKGKLSQKEWEQKGYVAWERAKDLWGIDDDELQVYTGYDTLKWSSPSDGKNEIATGGGAKLESVAEQMTVGLTGYLDGTIDTTTPDGQQQHQWIEGMLGLMGTGGERDPKTGDILPGTSHTEQVRDNIKSLRDTNVEMASLQNTTTQTLSVKQVRSELWLSLENSPGLDLTKKEIASLVKAGERPSSQEQLLNKQTRLKVERSLWFNRIKTGLSDPGAKVREGWKHTVAMLQLQQAFDTNNAWDTVVDGFSKQTARHKRNETLKRILAPFMASKDPADYIKWSGTKYSFAERGPQGVYGSRLSYGFETKDGTVDTTFTPDEGYWDPPERDLNSTEYSPTELMNKLLEVQQLMFTNLIKE